MLEQAEGFSPPNSQQRAKGADWEEEYHGVAGPVQATFPDRMFGGPQNAAFIEVMMNLTGIKHCADLDSGTPNCVAIAPHVGVL